MNDTPKAQGRWPNAPLALVLAQVRFEPTPETGIEYLSAAIRERTGGEYPQTNALQQISFVVGENSAVSPIAQPVVVGHDLLTDDGTRSVRFQEGALTYSASTYHDFPTFMGQLNVLLGALCDAGAPRVLRLGLRYVDFVIPSQGHVPEDYLIDDFCRSPKVLGEQSPIAFSLYDYERDLGGRLRIHFGRGFGPPMLPPDLLDSVPPPQFLVAKYSSGVSGVLDIDRWRPANEEMSAQQIADEFVVLREDMARAFHAIISDHARTEWRTKTSED